MECKQLHRQMVEERSIDVALDLMMKDVEAIEGGDNNTGGQGEEWQKETRKGSRLGYREKVQLSTIIFGLQDHHTQVGKERGL